MAIFQHHVKWNKSTNHWPMDIASTDTDANHFFLSASGNTGRNEVSGKLHCSQKQNHPGLHRPTSEVRHPTNHHSAFSCFTRNSCRQYLQGLSFLILLLFLSLLTYGHCKWWNTSLWWKVQSSMLKSMALQRWEQSAQRSMPLQIIEMTQQATSTSNNILSPTWFSET